MRHRSNKQNQEYAVNCRVLLDSQFAKSKPSERDNWEQEVLSETDRASSEHSCPESGEEWSNDEEDEVYLRRLEILSALQKGNPIAAQVEPKVPVAPVPPPGFKTLTERPATDCISPKVSKKPKLEEKDIRIWSLPLFPISYKEEREILKRGGRWPRGLKFPHGEYEVLPTRDELHILQWRYWITRLIRQSLIIISDSFSDVFIEDLLEMRRTVHKFLGNGSRKTTKLQSGLLSTIYALLRKCQTVYKTQEKL